MDVYGPSADIGWNGMKVIAENLSHDTTGWNVVCAGDVSTGEECIGDVYTGEIVHCLSTCSDDVCIGGA